MKFVLGRAENNVGIGENAGEQHFVHSPLCFQRPSSSGVNEGLINQMNLSQPIPVQFCPDIPFCIPCIHRWGHLVFVLYVCLTHSHTTTPFDAPGKQAF